MKTSKIVFSTGAGRYRRGRSQLGFALVVVITLMVLLSLLAVGLLSLSTVSLRSTTTSGAMREARSNARLALNLAIGQLQKHAGDDRRITMAADQKTGSPDGSSTAATDGRGHWTGVYRAWEPDSGVDAIGWSARPQPEFLGWLVTNGDDLGEGAATSGGGDAEVGMVGIGSVGDADPSDLVRVPLIELKSDGKVTGRMGWWTGDQGLKASLGLMKPDSPASVLAAQNEMQAAPANGFANVGRGNPFSNSDFSSPKVLALTGFSQSALLTSGSDGGEAIKPLFHDVAATTSGLLTNVRRGGFRKDLSVYLEARTPRAWPIDPLYRVDNEEGINMEELAAYYNLHGELNANAGRFRFTTDGASVGASTEALTMARSPVACESDYFHHFKLPIPVAYDMVLSLTTVPGSTQGRVRLRLVLDPIVSIWNPLDVPVVVPRDTVPSIKYWAIPFDIVVRATDRGRPVTYRSPMPASFGPDHNVMSLDMTQKNQELVLRPGEIVKISQEAGTEVGGASQHSLIGAPGYNYGTGYAANLKNGGPTGPEIEIGASASIEVSMEANRYSNGVGQRRRGGIIVPGIYEHTRQYSLLHNEFYMGRDRGQSVSLAMGGVFVDWDLGDGRVHRSGNLDQNRRQKTSSLRADQLSGFPQGIQPVTIPSASELSGTQRYFAVSSFRVKTERGFGDSRGTSWLARFNPKCFHNDFYNFSEEERDMIPFEYNLVRIANIRDLELGLAEEADGRQYFGAAWNNQDGGQPRIVTHSVPRSPLISLAAFQHSFANGFVNQRPLDTTNSNGFATERSREPLWPQISHAIGNSHAPPILPANATTGQMDDGTRRPLADHSYLANRALWDDWFLSSIAPQPSGATTESQAQVARSFFEGERDLPNRRYRPDLGGQEASEVISRLFSGANPGPDAVSTVAAMLRVEGMFNVNSTSVEAWKSVLSGLRGQALAMRDETGVTSIDDSDGGVPVTGQLSPEDLVLSESAGVSDPAQWVGRRELTEAQIQELAEAIVRQVRLRGPFLSLADFVNRRPEGGESLALAGTVEAALRDNAVSINRMFDESREVDESVASRFEFPEAERYQKSFGIPGIVKQADILTPIAPFISVRSDSFLVRGYGEALDENGSVTARAWCEAVVERGKDYLSGDSPPETLPDATRNEIDREFGRRFVIKSFRWLSPDEV